MSHLGWQHLEPLGSSWEAESETRRRRYREASERCSQVLMLVLAPAPLAQWTLSRHLRSIDIASCQLILPRDIEALRHLPMSTASSGQAAVKCLPQ